MKCPKSRFPIWTIVFEELELIIFVSQGLTLSTASLVDLFIETNYKKILLLDQGSIRSSPRNGPIELGIGGSETKKSTMPNAICHFFPWLLAFWKCCNNS